MVSGKKVAILVGVGAVFLYFLKILMNGPMCESTARLDGKVIIVTGANSGIGKATTLDFFKRGATVYMGCRSVRRAEVAFNEIKQEAAESTGQLVILELNLGSLASVRNFVDKFKSRESRLDILVNNAGVMYIDFNKTEDGFEETFAVNYLGHFLLTNLLLDNLKAASSSRVVTVSSLVHQYCHLNFTDLMGNLHYNSAFAYCQSKYAQMVFSFELGRRLNGTGVSSYSVHPGVVMTEMQRNIILFQIPVVREICTALTWPFFKDINHAAQTQICCAVSEAFQSQTALYYSDVAVQKPAAGVNDIEQAIRLWQVSEELVGLKPSLLETPN